MTIEIICLVVTIPLLIVGIVISVIGIRYATRSSQEISRKIDELKQIPPKIKVCFSDGTDGGTFPLRYKANTVDQIPIYIENIGEKIITRADISVYMDKNFFPIKLIYLGGEEADKVLETTPIHPYGSGIMQYLYTKSDFVLRKGEAEIVTLVTRMPITPAVYSLKVTLASIQGDGGIYELKVSII